MYTVRIRQMRGGREHERLKEFNQKEKAIAYVQNKLDTALLHGAGVRKMNTTHVTLEKERRVMTIDLITE